MTSADSGPTANELANRSSPSPFFPSFPLSFLVLFLFLITLAVDVYPNIGGAKNPKRKSGWLFILLFFLPLPLDSSPSSFFFSPCRILLVKRARTKVKQFIMMCEMTPAFVFFLPLPMFSLPFGINYRLEGQDWAPILASLLYFPPLLDTFLPVVTES